MKEPDEANCAESINDMTTLMKHKLVIRDVIHHFEKECTLNDNEKSLSFLLRRVVVEVTVMKKTHKKFVSALMNLI